MKFKIATKENINSIMDIIQASQVYLKGKGIDQWQNNYPNRDTINSDIENNNSYILTQNNIVVGTTALIFGNDKTYNSIYNGKWLTDGKYAVIHRLAINSECHRQGLGSVIIKYIEKICKNQDVDSIRVDTHKENISMQKVLNKNGFVYCGIIYLEDGNERIAFEKEL